MHQCTCIHQSKTDGKTPQNTPIARRRTSPSPLLHGSQSVLQHSVEGIGYVSLYHALETGCARWKANLSPTCSIYLQVCVGSRQVDRPNPRATAVVIRQGRSIITPSSYIQNNRVTTGHPGLLVANQHTTEPYSNSVQRKRAGKSWRRTNNCYHQHCCCCKHVCM